MKTVKGGGGGGGGVGKGLPPLGETLLTHIKLYERFSDSIYVPAGGCEAEESGGLPFTCSQLTREY